MQKPLHPLEIKLDESKKIISILFNDGKKYSICSELLRVESPSAEVQGHGGPKVLIINKEDVKIIDIKKIGNYAIRIIFSDGHQTGIYSWEKLLDFGLNQKTIMKEYRKKVKDHLQF
tara:strand:+ start:432 stop:782 length:351 start_codon:yes stop_codon:yes gene_type:complete